MAANKARGGLFCSSCLKSDREVKRLLAGAGVYICGGCVKACAGILLRSGFKRAPDFAGWDTYTDAQLLQSLAPSERTLEAVRHDLQAKVDNLRERGTSWEAIGNALGISRQAAWERFSQ